MTKFKKYIALMCVAVLMISVFSACSKKPEEESTTESTIESTTESTTEWTVPPITTEPSTEATETTTQKPETTTKKVVPTTKKAVATTKKAEPTTKKATTPLKEGWSADGKTYVENGKVYKVSADQSGVLDGFIAVDGLGLVPTPEMKAEIDNMKCSVCGKKSGNGTNGTCLRFINYGDYCPNCGVWVDVNTCHTCK